SLSCSSAWRSGSSSRWLGRLVQQRPASSGTRCRRGEGRVRDKVLALEQCARQARIVVLRQPQSRDRWVVSRVRECLFGQLRVAQQLTFCGPLSPSSMWNWPPWSHFSALLRWSLSLPSGHGKRGQPSPPVQVYPKQVRSKQTPGHVSQVSHVS